MRSILGIDTASPFGSVALIVDGSLRGVVALAPGGHSSGLSAAAEQIAASAGISLASLSGIAVSRGPGSFTGLRIGLAWAKGLAMGVPIQIPLALVSAHEAAAHSARDATTLRLTLTPGEQREVEIALWEAADPSEAGGGRPVALEPPVSIPEEDVEERISAMAGGRPFVALPSNEKIAALLDADDLPHRAPASLAHSVAMLGDVLLRSGEASDLVLAAPAYGRAPNARKPAR